MAEKKSWRDYSRNTAEEKSESKTANEEKTGMWRDYSKPNVSGNITQSEKKTGSWRDYSTLDTASIVGNNIVNRVNNWLQGNNDYITAFQTRFGNRKGGYEDAYVSDSADWLETVRGQKSSFDAEADGILSYMEQYKDYLDDGWMSQVKSALQSAKSTQSKILNSSIKDNMYWESWETEDDYIKGATEASGERQQRYESNQKRIEEIEAKLPWYGKTFLPSSVEKWFLSKEKDALVDERDTLKSENLKYERGEDGYVSKAVDEHSKVTQNSDFDTRSANRDYANSSKEDMDLADLMNDSTTWQWDANRVYRDAYGNELVLDKNGNYYSPAAPQVKVEDKLALYLNTSEDERVAAAADVSGKMDGTWKSLMRQGYDGAWEYLTENEKGTYYYYLDESQESADKYLSDMKIELNRRRTYDQIGQYNTAYDKANFLEKIFLNAGTIPAKFISTATGFIEDSVDTLMGNDINPYSAAHAGMHYTQTIRGNTEEDLDATGFKIPILDFTLGDIYNTGMSRLDSALATSVFNGGGTVFLGMGAAEEEAYKLYQQGASAEQITVGSLAAGAAEAIWEYLSYGKLKEIKNVDNPGKWVKSVLVQGWNELTEEAATEVSNIISNALVMGSQSDLAELYKKNEEDAFKTFVGLAKQTAQAGFGGFLGGMGAGVTQATGAYADATSRYRNAGRTIMGVEGGVDALKGLANGVAGVSTGKIQKNLNKQIAAVDKNATSGKVGRLYGAVQNANNLANADANKADIVKSLTRKGIYSETANDIADALVALYNGQDLTKAQTQLLKAVENDTAVQEAVRDIVTNEMSTMGQRNQNVRDFQRDLSLGILAKAFNAPAEYKSLEDRVGTESSFKVSDEGQATVSETGEGIDLSKAEVAEFVKDKDGKIVDMVIDVDGKQVKASEVSFANGNQSYLFEAVSKIENITPRTATTIIRDYDPASGQTAGEYLNGVDEAFTYGYYSYSEADMNAGKFAPKLTETQRKTAYELGRRDRSMSDTAADAPVVKMRTAAEAKMTAEEKTAKQKAKIESEDTEVYFRDGKNAVKFDEHTGKYDKKRMAAVNTAKFLSKLGIGGKYYFYESYMKDGVRVYKDTNGKEVEAPNGVYMESDGSIHIDLNAGNAGQGTALFTLAHELTHFVKDRSKKQFKILNDLVAEAFDKTDISMHKRVLAKQKFLESKRGKAVSYTEAHEEVVADALSTMLSDGSFYDLIMEIKVKDKGLFATIKRFFKDMIAKFTKEYENLTPDQQDAQDIRQMKDMFDKIQKAFAEALVEASDNFQATKAQKTAKAMDTSSNQTLAEQPMKDSDRKNKKIPSNQQSAIVGRPVKQGGSNSTHNKMSSAAAARILGITNIANSTESVKNAISVLGTFYHSVDTKSAVMGFKKPISGSNLEGSLVSAGVLYRSGNGGSAYRKDGDHELRISTHSSHASNFKGAGEHLSIVLRGNRAINRFLKSENNVIEVVFYKSALDKNPEMLKALINDIAHFIAFGEYHDTAGASVHLYSGTEEFQKAAEKRMEKDKLAREQKFSDRDSNGNQLSKEQQAFFEKSTVRDEQGRLLVMYHGTPNGGFTKFRSGTYFTQNAEYADVYQNPGASSISAKSGAEAPMTYEVYLDIKKPFDTRNPKERRIFMEEFYRKYGTSTPLADSGLPDWIDGMDLQEFIEEMEYDYDGLILDEGGVGGYGDEVKSRGFSYVVFSPEQVKDVNNKQPTSDPDIRYSYRGVNKDGIEVYETSVDIKKLSYKDRQQKFLDIMANDYRGRTAKFIRNGHTYYATFEEKDVNKNIYGDKRSDKKGYKAKINVGADGDIFELVENAQYNGSLPEKGKKITAHRGVGYWDYFIKNVQIDGTVFNLTANVRKKADGAFVYSIQLNENKKIKASPPLGLLSKALNGVTNASNKRITQPASKVNSQNSGTNSERGEDTSNRALLANAFEGLFKSSVEYKMIQDYKEQIKVLNLLDEQLSDLNAEIHEIRFTKGKYDAEKLRKLEEKAERIARDINKQDKVLIRMEASEPLRKIIEFERKKASQKTKEHIAEIQQNKKLRAEQTELRHKIRRTVRDLDKLLNRGNKKRNVKEDMQGFVSKALELADYLFTDHISDDDLIRRGINLSLMRDNEAEIVKETEDILTQLYDKADSLTDEEFTELDAKRKDNEAKLRDLLTAQRNERLSTPVYNLFNDLVTEYASLKNSTQEAVKDAYNPKVEEFLRSYLGETTDGTDSDRKTMLQNMRLADMTTEELWKLHNAYTMVLHSVRTANKLFVNGKTESLEQMANRIVADFSQRKAPDGKAATAIRNLSNKLGWDYEKLYYALDRIGSEAFTELVMNVANSENIVMEDVKEAKAFLRDIVKKYDFNNWDYSKEIDRDFLDTTGKKFRMTLGQLMSLYAYSRREGAWDHIEYGGFVFGETALTNPKPADSYKLSKDQCEALTNALTKEQKAYVEDMQKFLSETMGAKGNEVSMLLYGIKMFGEKNYFPIHIAGQFKAQANEPQAKAAAGFGTMTNAGFTHAQNPNAKAPFVLEGFNEIWADHVNEMSRYHGTVPALEDMRRVMNRSSYSEAEADSMAIKQLMENSFGKEAVDYFDNLYREANSGAIADKLQKLPRKLLSLFRKNSVAYSLSVVIQQPSAMARAYAMIDKKYFGFKGVGALTSGVAKAVTSKWNPAYANAYNEMLKYAPGVTLAKEIGGFDTHTGSSIREYLLDTEKSFKQSMKTENLKEKGKAMLDLVDDNAIANLPTVADKIAWIEIWNACKRETVAKHKDLAVSSEEFMQIVGERFTEVIRATQVYDSIFAKSPLLKSKSLAVQYLVSFMNEPNTTANMVGKAVRDAANGDWKGGLRIAGAVTYSIIFNNVLKAIVYAMRDDDEDETYIEKYIAAVTGGLIDDFLPMNYIPVVRDVWSKVRGFDIERPDMAIITDAIDAYQALEKAKDKDTEGMTEEELAEMDKKVTDASWKLIGSVAAFFGIPVKNVYREVEGIVNQIRIASKNAGMTTPDSLLDKVKEEIADTIPFGAKETKTDKLYGAIVGGDAKYIERIKGTYRTEEAYQSAVRKALRENDTRIHDAAQARADGNTEEYKRIFREIQKEGNFTFDDIMSAINSEESKIRKDTEPEKAISDYTANGYVEAVAMGNTTEAQAMKDDIIAAKVANGKTQEDAEMEFKSSVATGIGEAYSSGLLDEAQAEKMLIEYAGKEEEEAASKVSYWSFLDAHPEYEQYNLSESNVGDYLEFAEPAEIPMDVYVQFRDGTKGIAEIKDEWGDVEVTKREQVLEVIDSLPITWQQKDALYLAAGYSESKIWDVPW